MNVRFYNRSSRVIQYVVNFILVIDKYSSLLAIEKEILYSELKIASNEKKTCFTDKSYCYLKNILIFTNYTVYVYFACFFSNM